MALTRINLSGSVCVDNGCSQLNFSDTTGFLVSPCVDSQNNLGYGLAGGIALNDVTSAVLNVYFPAITTPIIFNFTIVNGAITACTLTDLKGIVNNIYSKLASTVSPLVNFNIALNYGVSIPIVADGLYKWDYTINGTSATGVPFNYTTSDAFISDCNAQCCTSNAYLDIDKDCSCSDAKKMSIINQEIFLNGAAYAMNVNMNSKADEFLADAIELCNNKCKDC